MIALALALLCDLVLGEPPSALHPVVWMGWTIRAAERAAPRRDRFAQLVYGAAMALAIPAAFAAASLLVPWWAAFAVCKCMFALRALGVAARRVGDAVAGGRIEEARAGLRSLCSRDASELDGPQLVAATIESVAENTSDSFVAPLFYYALFGLPGAVAYRAINTMDAMIGYHGRYEWLGKAAARLDDFANLIPARLTALLLLAAGRRRADGWRILRRDASKTESPNAGRPMAAMAGLLGVELEKVGHYRLGDPIEPLEHGKIAEAWHTVRRAALGFALLALLTCYAR